MWEIIAFPIFVGAFVIALIITLFEICWDFYNKGCIMTIEEFESENKQLRAENLFLNLEMHASKAINKHMDEELETHKKALSDIGTKNIKNQGQIEALKWVISEFIRRCNA